LTPLIEKIIGNCKKNVSCYIEPFAGGAGIALNLLFNEIVENVILNDYDKAIYSFWRSILLETDAFIEKVKSTPINVCEWRHQKDIYLSSTNYSLDFAFATFYLNRTNRSGIISAGPIGGYLQHGNWKLNARYNLDNCIDRILKIAKYKKKIKIYNMDIRMFIAKYHKYLSDNCFVYFDPPYVNNSKRLYKNSLDLNDHIEISKCICEYVSNDWIITYDDVNIIRDIYRKYPIMRYDISYCVADKRKDNELLICKNKYLLKGIVDGVD
jgi:DNA adenine methylase